jgi:hypothetical protein
MSAMLFSIDLIYLFLFLYFLSTRLNVSATIHAASDHLRVVRDGLVLAHVLLVNEVICGCYRVVSIRLDTLDCVFVIESVLVLHDLEDLFIVGHFFGPWEKPADAFFLGQLEPGVRADFLYRIS